MTHRIASALTIVVVCLLEMTALTAQQGVADSWYGRLGAKSKDFDAPKTFSGTFQIELPKDWQLVPGHKGTVFLVAEKKKGGPGAAIILEYQSLQAPITVSPSLGNQLLKDAQAFELAGTNFSQQPITKGDRSLILIQYDRPGLTGGRDHVVQYSIPVGLTMYHLICIAPKEDTEKYRSTFAYTAASFTASKPGA